MATEKTVEKAPAAAEAPKGMDWDEIIANYMKTGEEKEEGEVEEKKKPQSTSNLPEGVLAFVQDQMVAKAQENAVADMRKFAPELKDVPDAILKATIVGAITMNGDFDKAFANRGKNPAAWKAIGEKLAKELAGNFSGLMKTKELEVSEEEGEEEESGDLKAAARAAGRSTTRTTKDAEKAAKAEKDAEFLALTPGQKMKWFRDQGIRLNF